MNPDPEIWDNLQILRRWVNVKDQTPQTDVTTELMIQGGSIQAGIGNKITMLGGPIESNYTLQHHKQICTSDHR